MTCPQFCLGNVTQIAVGGVDEGKAILAKLKMAVGQGAGIASGLLDHILRADFQPFGFLIGDGLAIEEEEIVGRAAVGEVFFDGIGGGAVPGLPVGMADHAPTRIGQSLINTLFTRCPLAQMRHRFLF
jgi:hypothetical protein